MRGKRYENEKQQVGRNWDSNVDKMSTLRTIEKISEETEVSSKTIQRDEKFAKAIDEIAFESW